MNLCIITKVFKYSSYFQLFLRIFFKKNKKNLKTHQTIELPIFKKLKLTGFRLNMHIILLNTLPHVQPHTQMWRDIHIQ